MNAAELRCVLSWPFGHKWKMQTRRDPSTSTYEQTRLLVCSRCGKEDDVGKGGEIGRYLDNMGDD